MRRLESKSYEPDEITDAMIEAARLALIGWYEGVRDFRDGAILILEAGIAARGEPVELEGRAIRGANKTP